MITESALQSLLYRNVCSVRWHIAASRVLLIMVIARYLTELRTGFLH